MKLLMVANRLPITIDKLLEIKGSIGGLSTGMASYCQQSGHEIQWIGWPGIIPKKKDKQPIEDELAKHSCVPVFLSKTDLETFYHGFCNKTIWPLFHYFTSFATYDTSLWDSYCNVNRVYAEAVIKLYKPGQIIWVHDYHLMLVPKLVRAVLPEASIGFFLHTPFPQHEVFRILPSAWRRELLQSLMGCDLVGFHTEDYTDYFLVCLEKLLGHKHTDGVVQIGNRLCRVKTFPMGIDYNKFHTAGADVNVISQSKTVRDQAKGKVIISVDRLDYSKGIINRLKGYELFLQNNPTWHKNVTLIMQVVPSREGVDHYWSMKRQIDEAIGQINGSFGGVDWTPIMYQYKGVPMDELIPLYAASDVALITPLRDGMNLVAKEYVATRQGTGVLILSEMAGAANEMQEAIIVNPNNVGEIAAALLQAVTMPEEDQKFRNTKLQQKLKDGNVVQWATNFLSQFINNNAANAA